MWAPKGVCSSWRIERLLPFPVTESRQRGQKSGHFIGSIVQAYADGAAKFIKSAKYDMNAYAEVET
jgi:hypothetical protein